LAWRAGFRLASTTADRRIEVLCRISALLNHALAFTGFNIPRLERFCAAKFWDADAWTRFLVPNHALKLIVDHLGVTSVINEAFARAVIEVEVIIDCTVLLDTQAFSGNEIPSRELIVAV